MPFRDLALEDPDPAAGDLVERDEHELRLPEHAHLAPALQPDARRVRCLQRVEVRHGLVARCGRLGEAEAYATALALRDARALPDDARRAALRAGQWLQLELVHDRCGLGAWTGRWRERAVSPARRTTASAATGNGRKVAAATIAAVISQAKLRRR